MSDLYVEQYKAENKCSQCKSAVCQVGRRKYKMCYGHLLKARCLYKDWRDKRHAAGLCTFCSNPLAKWPDGRNKSWCANHLAYFREYSRIKWRTHSAKCVKLGLCVEFGCGKKSIPGEQRCAPHKERNRVRCLSWSHEHPEHSHKEWLVRKARLAQGICICKEQRPLPPGQRRCDPCRRRQRAYR